MKGGSFFEKTGGGKKTASVLDALEVLPICISSAKCAKCHWTTAKLISRSLREGKLKALSSKYSMQKISKRIPSEKVRLGCLMMRPEEQGELS